jgi:hypothetical protein
MVAEAEIAALFGNGEGTTLLTSDAQLALYPGPMRKV